MRQLLGLVAFLVILLSSCGGSDTTASTTEVEAPPPGTAPSTTPTISSPAQNVDAPVLDGTDWNVTDYIQASGSITNVWKTEVTISFSADGTVSGSAGCNDFQAKWKASGAYDEFEPGIRDPNDGQELSLEDLSWSAVACEDEAIMEQEAEILDLLQRTGRWVVIRGSLNLRDAEGAFLFNADTE